METSIMTIFLLLFIHYIADFICQPHEIASTKSHNIEAMLIHIIIYSLITFMFLMFTIPGDIFSFVSVINYTCILGLFHGLTDIVTSKFSKYLWNKGKVGDFFNLIGFDQLIHQTTILMLYYYVL